jgi:hypothetical protein
MKLYLISKNESAGGRGRELTLFTKSNLAELARPILPNPISNTRSHDNRNNDREEDAHARGAVFLVEFVAVAGTGVRDADFHLVATLAGIDGDFAVAGWFVPFDTVGVIGAEEGVVGGCEAGDEGAGTVGLALVVEVTV